MPKLAIQMQDVLKTKIEFLKGVGPQKASILNKDLAIFTYEDLIQHFPFRYEDRTKIYKINELRSEMSNILLKGKIINASTQGTPTNPRLVAHFKDETGTIELIWFQGVRWATNNITVGKEYLVFGKPSLFGTKLNIAHPEIELFTEQKEGESLLSPVYHTSDGMKRKFLDSNALCRLMKDLLSNCIPQIAETLPDYILQKYGFISRREAMAHIHFPSDEKSLQKARARLKFEELFYIQLKMLAERGVDREINQGIVFKNLSKLRQFYTEILPFDLTNAQKKVIKEIREDVASGKQMNRLLQGDVGSGKTVVAFICMLMAFDNESQACLMAPTEILAEQHYQGLSEFCEKLGLTVLLLTGSTKKKERTEIHQKLLDGSLDLLIGTHALLENIVQFKNLGICVIDEQHRFGVAQRAKLWAKNPKTPPHILVMTATPIPRTLAMTVYGDLEVSVIDELPAGRKPIQTYHKYESARLNVWGMIKKELEKGHQAYVVFPLIEESEKVDLKNLMDGYHDLVRNFPDHFISIVHGKLTPQEKESEMARFVKKQTHIMVATTVIEVGVNIPNATIMVIENADRFGLAQLHQLRGRVGRGGNQSHCVLVTGNKLSADAKTRMETLVRTTDGFEIADVDLRLRGPGDLSGTQQSGILDLKLANIVQDAAILKAARDIAQLILTKDLKLQHPANEILRNQLKKMKGNKIDWGAIS
jgi:ATP-dependent DNA helicase RecG